MTSKRTKRMRQAWTRQMQSGSITASGKYRAIDADGNAVDVPLSAEMLAALREEDATSHGAGPDDMLSRGPRDVAYLGALTHLGRDIGEGEHPEVYALGRESEAFRLMQRQWSGATWLDTSYAESLGWVHRRSEARRGFLYASKLTNRERALLTWARRVDAAEARAVYHSGLFRRLKPARPDATHAYRVLAGWRGRVALIEAQYLAGRAAEIAFSRLPSWTRDARADERKARNRELSRARMARMRAARRAELFDAAHANDDLKRRLGDVNRTSETTRDD